jgi:hypothetical protein
MSQQPEKPTQGGDRARDDLAMSAQVTLISILLGAILGALFAGLPQNFATNAWSLQALPVDLRVFATFLAAVDIWMEYAWAVIVHKWPFSLTHNLSYFAIAGALAGAALSVSELSAWLVWSAVACGAATIATAVDVLRPIEHALKRASREKAAIDDDYISRLRKLRTSTRVQFLVYLTAIPVLVYGSLDASNSLPEWAQLSINHSLWGLAVIIIVGIDMLIEGRAMAEQRYKPPLIF